MISNDHTGGTGATCVASLLAALHSARTELLRWHVRPWNTRMAPRRAWDTQENAYSTFDEAPYMGVL